MTYHRSKRPWLAYVLALVVFPVAGTAVSVAIVTRSWEYFERFRSVGTVPGPVTGATNTAPSLDVKGAVTALRGTANPKLKAAALAVLEQQARLGNAKAMVMTAACYRAALGTAQEDPAKAFEWYRKAALAGEPVAMVEMARYTAEGVWVEANPAESKRWLERAAQAGNVEAKWQIAKGDK
jgi:hypothetical protein